MTKVVANCSIPAGTRHPIVSRPHFGAGSGVSATGKAHTRIAFDDCALYIGEWVQ
jgi:hypothetical protein